MNNVLHSLPDGTMFELGLMKFKKVKEYESEISCITIEQHVKASGKTWNLPKSLAVNIITK